MPSEAFSFYFGSGINHLDMELTYVPLDEQGEDKKKSRHLFETAFLPEERPPFSRIRQWDHTDFKGIYRDGEFVGFRYALEKEDLTYLFFFAIEERFRNQGIGTQVLRDLVENSGGARIFLLADEPGEDYPDNAMRLRRLAFYERNGFKPNGMLVHEFGVRYWMLTKDGVTITAEEYLDMMVDLMGRKRVDRHYQIG